MLLGKVGEFEGSTSCNHFLAFPACQHLTPTAALVPFSRRNELIKQITYDHEPYWPTLLETCLQRRADQLEKWRALGEPQCGRSETLFKVSPKPVSEASQAISDDLGVD